MRGFSTSLMTFGKPSGQSSRWKKSGYNYQSLEPKLYFNISIKVFLYSFKMLGLLGIKLPRNQEKSLLCSARNFTKSFSRVQKIFTNTHVTFGIWATNTHLHQSQCIAVTFKMILHMPTQLASSLCLLAHSSPSIETLKYINTILFLIKFLYFPLCYHHGIILIFWELCGQIEKTTDFTSAYLKGQLLSICYKKGRCWLQYTWEPLD